jgi:cobalt-zinc-cadmium resistance protein CzcA
VVLSVDEKSQIQALDRTQPGLPMKKGRTGTNERFIPVKFSVRDRDLGSTVEEAQRRIAEKIKLPNGYRIAWAGEFDSLQQVKARLAIIVPVSLGIILLLLYGLFNSLRDRLMARVGIPFAAGGGILALYFFNLDFSISAAVGFISLFGVSVMNGILITTTMRCEPVAKERSTPCSMRPSSACAPC